MKDHLTEFEDKPQEPLGWVWNGYRILYGFFVAVWCCAVIKHYYDSIYNLIKASIH